MTRWLLAAEADKIQDFVFSSSRLVQVVGGSSLLTRFCEDVPPTLIEYYTGRRPQAGDESLVITGGGSFRLTLDDPSALKSVGQDLAEAYYRSCGGSLTVSEPREYETDTFAKASRQVEADLRVAKEDRQKQSAATAQMPYTALCASCGMHLATSHTARHPDDRANYLCRACQVKAAERDIGKKEPWREGFLSRFFEALQRTNVAEVLPTHFDPDLFPKDADAVGNHDPRGYVAYLVADGNGMGLLFSACQTSQAMQELSNALTGAMWSALAQVSARLAPHLWKAEQRKTIPVTPLIAGGDDLFALLPAPYCLDFARQVCLEFQKALLPTAQKHGLVTDDPKSWPTMSAAVVICKKNYPYALAHRLGEELLGRTKRLTRGANLLSEVNLPSVDFVVVHGSDIESGDKSGTRGRKQVVPTAAPYWGGDQVSQKALQYAISVKNLLDLRLEFKALPGKRRAELRELFIDALPAEAKPRKREEILTELSTSWEAQLQALLSRIAPEKQQRGLLRAQIDKLGDPEGVHARWRCFAERDDEPWSHGLPDLLEIWDFAQDLDHSLEEYVEEGR